MPSIQLDAALVGGKVRVTGPTGTINLPHNSGKHRFNFHLRDSTGLNVEFRTPDWLDVDEGTDCPPSAGINSDQIENADAQKTNAHFTDKNSGPPRDLCYALHFRCDDPRQHPVYDPVIRNGGGDD